MNWLSLALILPVVAVTIASDKLVSPARRQVLFADVYEGVRRVLGYMMDDAYSLNIDAVIVLRISEGRESRAHLTQAASTPHTGCG